MKTETQHEPGGHVFKSVKEIEANVRTRMEKAVSDLQHDMASIRTGRASVSILDHVRIDYYGTPTPLNQLGNLHVPEPSMITVQPWDVSQIGAIEKAIRAANLGLNPGNDGKLIRIPIPPLTEERRKDLVKVAGKYAEQQKVAVRNVRRDANDDLKKAEKDGAISQDEHKRLETEVQKLTDEAIKRVDEALKTKEQEIMHV